MGCAASTQCMLDSIDNLKKSYSVSENDYCDSVPHAIKLAKGGYVFETKIGNIQFGIPPETVKDSLIQGLKVPTYYIVPTSRFDKALGITLCEFEFPAYYNYFFLKKRVVLICDAAQEKAIRAIFQETLLGP
jgi:hypothetical protein